MNIRNFIAASVIATLPLTASAASLIIPASGTGAGANASRWQSELTLHNTGSRTLVLEMEFHGSNDEHAVKSVSLLPRATRSLADVVKNEFGFETATGAIVIEVPDADASRLAVTSRTLNVSDAGTFGQDIPAYRIEDAAVAGDIAVLSAPSSATADRFNFGVYAISDTTVTWRLVRADGTIAATADATYKAGAQKQYNNGVVSLLSSTAADNDTIHAIVKSGKALFYGSAINQASGDPSFVPAVRAREDLRITFLGVDLDENGSADLLDADRNGIVDTVMDVTTSTFPAYFRLIVSGLNGEAATISVIESPASYALLADNTIQLAPTGDLKGKTGNLVVRITAGGETSIVTIPVKFN
jgi:hypothetical protein